MKQLFAFILLLISSYTFAATNPSVVMDTSEGQIVLELFPVQAPDSVANFLAYIKKDGYKETTFHRVIKGFMIQGGGMTSSGAMVPSLAPINNESKNGLLNLRGSIAMARTEYPHSATRQFFINHVDNGFLDTQGSRWGYAVFGKVTMGMDVVDKIAMAKTNHRDKPLKDIIINSISLTNNDIK